MLSDGLARSLNFVVQFGYDCYLYLYKQHIETDTGALNSQGREQIHSILDKCSSSLRHTNYFNFVRYMSVFFAIRNFNEL